MLHSGVMVKTSIALDWSALDTVLLDMDGTLLDLHFDNYFWQQRIPERYAQQHGLANAATALEILMPDFLALQGQLEWYCLDYWSEALSLDVSAIKAELAAERPTRVQIRPHTLDFLQALRVAGKTVWLTTNAHPRAIEIKFAQLAACEITPVNMQQFFDNIITSHQLGAPKEQQTFWQTLQQTYPFDKKRAIFVDDSFSVLAAAHQFGIAECVAITQPDSQQSRELSDDDMGDYHAITYFDEMMPVV